MKVIRKINRSHAAPVLSLIHLGVTLVLLVALFRVTTNHNAEAVDNAVAPVEQTVTRGNEQRAELFSVLWCFLIEGPDGQLAYYQHYSIDLLVACASELDAEVTLKLPPAPR